MANLPHCCFEPPPPPPPPSPPRNIHAAPAASPRPCPPTYLPPSPPPASSSDRASPERTRAPRGSGESAIARSSEMTQHKSRRAFSWFCAKPRNFSSCAATGRCAASSSVSKSSCHARLLSSSAMVGAAPSRCGESRRVLYAAPGWLSRARLKSRGRRRFSSCFRSASSPRALAVAAAAREASASRLGLARA